MWHKPTQLYSSLTPADRQPLEAGLRSSDAVPLRRGQLLLASARRQRPTQMAWQLGCASPRVRQAMRVFHPRGLALVQAHVRRPERLRLTLDAKRLGTLLHERPRAFGKPRRTDPCTDRPTSGGNAGARPPPSASI